MYSFKRPMGPVPCMALRNTWDWSHSSIGTSHYNLLSSVPARSFKNRLYEHNSSFKNEAQRHKTTLSDHIWKLKNQGEPHTVSWWVIDRGKAFNPTTKTCDLCLREKYHIMFNPHTATLNDRREIFATCRHRTKLLLCKQ